MAEGAVAPVSGFAATWLDSHRDELNGRFRQAARRWPALESQAVLDWTARVLPRLGEGGTLTDGTADLLAAAWDLILLHCGRGTISRPGVAPLLLTAFPALRPLLLARPRSLPGALSNAVENLGARGEAFALALPEIAARLLTPAQLDDAASVLAWGLGEARLRGEALDAAVRLPKRAALDALLLRDWPDEAAPQLFASLHTDGWCRPGDSPAAEPRAATVGGFSGFDGSFEEPPLLLDPGPDRSRHRFFALTGAGAWRIDTDVFGWTCRPDAAAAVFPVREARARDLPAEAAGATSCASAPGLVAWTTADSMRIRILASRSPGA